MKQRSQQEFVSTDIPSPSVQCEEKNEELHNKHGSEAFEYLEVDGYLLVENLIWKLE